MKPCGPQAADQAAFLAQVPSRVCYWIGVDPGHGQQVSCLLSVVVLMLLQEIQPSGPNGPTVTMGDYVRDLLLEQVSRSSSAGDGEGLGTGSLVV